MRGALPLPTDALSAAVRSNVSVHPKTRKCGGASGSAITAQRRTPGCWTDTVGLRCTSRGPQPHSVCQWLIDHGRPPLCGLRPQSCSGSSTSVVGRWGPPQRRRRRVPTTAPRRSSCPRGVVPPRDRSTGRPVARAAGHEVQVQQRMRPWLMGGQGEACRFAVVRACMRWSVAESAGWCWPAGTRRWWCWAQGARGRRRGHHATTHTPK